MRFNLITNYNGYGLEQDANVLAGEIERCGHEVCRVQFCQLDGRLSRVAPPADVNVFLEVIKIRHLASAPRNWVVPNPEWFYAGWPLSSFERVLAKTRDTERIFRGLVHDRCAYTGWKARDLYSPGAKRERRFLHVAGKSSFKNTKAVIEGCRLANAPLTVISQSTGRMTDAALAEAFNSHAFFLCPSMYEGFGHALHEALGCGAVVITTDAPPMNEIRPAVLVRPSNSFRHNLATMHHVSPEAVAEAVETALAFSDSELETWVLASRAAFELESHTFSENIAVLLGAEVLV